MNNTKNINVLDEKDNRNEETIKEQLTLEEARILLGKEFKKLANSCVNSKLKIKEMLDIFNTLFPEFLDSRIQLTKLKPHELFDKEETIFIDCSTIVKGVLNIEGIEKNNMEDKLSNDSFGDKDMLKNKVIPTLKEMINELDPWSSKEVAERRLVLKIILTELEKSIKVVKGLMRDSSNNAKNEVDVFLEYLDRETLEFKNIISEIESKKDEATIREEKAQNFAEAALQMIESIKSRIDKLKECTKQVKDKYQK